MTDEAIKTAMISAISAGNTLAKMVTMLQAADAEVKAAAESSRNIPLPGAMTKEDWATYKASQMDGAGETDLSQPYRRALVAMQNDNQLAYFLALSSAFKAMRLGFPGIQ